MGIDLVAVSRLNFQKKKKKRGGGGGGRSLTAVVETFPMMILLGTLMGFFFSDTHGQLTYKSTCHIHNAEHACLATFFIKKKKKKKKKKNRRGIKT